MWWYRILRSIHFIDNKRNKVSSRKGQILGSLFRCLDQTWLNYLISLASMCGVTAVCQLVGSWYKKDEWKDHRDGFLTRSKHGDPILRCHSANVILKTLSAADSFGFLTYRDSTPHSVSSPTAKHDADAWLAAQESLPRQRRLVKAVRSLLWLSLWRILLGWMSGWGGCPWLGFHSLLPNKWTFPCSCPLTCKLPQGQECLSVCSLV